MAFALAGCKETNNKRPLRDTFTELTDLDVAEPVDVTETADTGEVADVPGDTGPMPVPDIKAAALAFKLYYRERVERTIIAYNRFMLVGGTNFGTTIGKIGISRKGTQWEVVPGPNDNNHIGASVWATWYAYRIFGTRTLALSLIRMFNGLTFLEAISGHPGLTARMVYPGWTRVVDGIAGTVSLTRNGTPVKSPFTSDAALDPEILSTFYNGVNIRYRENPEDILLNYMPSQEIGPYAVTYNFSMLPAYLRVSDCCTSLMRTPSPYTWEGAFWGNHNSRDNFPDLSLGYIAAMEAAADQTIDPDVSGAAKRAWEAGQRIGGLIEANKGKLMTVDEHNPYDKLVVAGAVRPDGTTESQDLGSMADCQMVYLARALSSGGLDLPVPSLPMPGSIEKLFASLIDKDSGCSNKNEVHNCMHIDDAYCGKTWGTMNELTIKGTPWLDLARQLEQKNPGTAKMLLGSFQDDFHEISLAALALTEYAKGINDQELLTRSMDTVKEITDLMDVFADIIYTQNDPTKRKDQRYKAALVAAQAGIAVDPADLEGFAHAQSQISRLESVPDMPDTTDAALITDQDILQQVEDRLKGSSAAVKARYKAAYPDLPPIRRIKDGYEARIADHGKPGAWHSVGTPHHFQLGGIHLLEALPLCITNPGILDCTWARLGCARPDLDHNGKVDTTDQGLFDQASLKYEGIACDANNDWCSGADLDHTHRVDSTDAAFMAAAIGCHYP